MPDAPAAPPAQAAAMQFDGAMAGSPEQAFWTWRQIAAVFFDVALPTPEAMDHFRVAVDSHDLGGVVIGRIAASAQIFRRSSFTIARTGVDHFLIQLYRQGGYQGVAGELPITVRPGDVCILDMAQTLHTSAEDFENITLVMPRASLAPLVPKPEALHGVVVEGGTPLGRLLGEHLVGLQECGGQLTQAEAQPLLQATAMLVAACATPVLAARQEGHAPVHTPSLVLIRRFIESNLAAPQLSPEMLTRQFGVSRPTLYRLFEPYGGVASYIRRRRLERCFQEITAAVPERRRIAEIAYGWGFRNEAAFSRSFREAFGMSPREARLAGGTRPAGGPLRPEPPAEAAKEGGKEKAPATTGWIRRL
ncbi:helix-turn-helix domain-containing protein [Pseudoroseomonas cervicalis]|uniref:helix-turn-helix domain-containing protein n=1 Tax=Teichococcus cervicalis TaxID=204525 RepID=UPI00278B9163|nr:helix-turn-helix domain-containing protein [Pseudoroseomonas cervicalis]MDQ1078127.1 AraC-like DNA-binding protein [Pseudoroseomonas cervicalis]